MHILFSFGLLFAVCCLLFLRVLYYFIHVLPNVLSISRSQSQHEVTYVCTQYTVMYKVRLTVHVCFELNMWHVACDMALPATLPLSTLSSALVGRLVLVYTRILHLNTKTNHASFCSRSNGLSSSVQLHVFQWHFLIPD